MFNRWQVPTDLRGACCIVFSQSQPAFRKSSDLIKAANQKYQALFTVYPVEPFNKCGLDELARGHELKLPSGHFWRPFSQLSPDLRPVSFFRFEGTNLLRRQLSPQGSVRQGKPSLRWSPRAKPVDHSLLNMAKVGHSSYGPGKMPRQNFL